MKSTQDIIGRQGFHQIRQNNHYDNLLSCTSLPHMEVLKSDTFSWTGKLSTSAGLWKTQVLLKNFSTQQECPRIRKINIDTKKSVSTNTLHECLSKGLVM